VDLNGDGYPDFVLDSDPVDFQAVPPSSTPTPVDGVTVDGQVWQLFAPKRTNEIRAAFNVRGVRFDTDTEAFSRSVDLMAEGAEQGVSQWTCLGGGLGEPCDESNQSQVAGFADVNGDGLLDRVVGTSPIWACTPARRATFPRFTSPSRARCLPSTAPMISNAWSAGR
jgi:hypothetical protein